MVHFLVLRIIHSKKLPDHKGNAEIIKTTEIASRAREEVFI